MSKTGKRFPLSLAEVGERATPANRAERTAARTHTPQTATRNAAANQQPAVRNSAASQQSANRNAIGLPSANRDSGQPGGSARTAEPARRPVPAVNPAVAAAGAIRPVTASGSERLRRAMVERIAQQGVRDPKVLAAMEAVPRHLFIEPGFASQAYIDASLPIGHHQTISQPYIVARMIEIMRANNNGGKLNRVLEIGTGCGYQAAVLSLVADEVYSIERIRALHELAKSNLRPLRIANVRLQFGDGMLGLPQVAPFDGIILAAAGLEVPAALLEQLSTGGRLVAPVGGQNQVLQLIERKSRYDWSTATLEDCRFVPLCPGTS